MANKRFIKICLLLPLLFSSVACQENKEVEDISSSSQISLPEIKEDFEIYVNKIYYQYNDKVYAFNRLPSLDKYQAGEVFYGYQAETNIKSWNSKNLYLKDVPYGNMQSLRVYNENANLRIVLLTIGTIINLEYSN
jgi:hypothetical protein